MLAAHYLIILKDIFICRYFTRYPHFPGSNESLQQAIYIKGKWIEYGMSKVEMKKYNIMLSRPEKPGVVALYNASGHEIYRSAPQEKFLIPSENDSRVVPPFNAYAPAGSVKVGYYVCLFQRLLATSCC